MATPVLTAEHLTVTFPTPRGPLRALDDVNLTLQPGEVLGVVGESGSGKTTLGFALQNLIRPPGQLTGRVLFEERVDLLSLEGDALRRMRWEKFSMVFQAGQNTFNPVLTIRQQIQHILLSHDRPVAEGVAYASHLMERVGLPPDRVLTSYPHELSGGMKQRVGIVLSLLLHPPVVLLDEPTTALDVLTQDTVIRTVQTLHESLRFAIIFITHDFGVVAKLAQRVAVMYAGRVVEVGDVVDLFRRPYHPYTRALLRSRPRLDTDEPAEPIPGEPPNLAALPPGCPFAPRCPLVTPACREGPISLAPVEDGRAAACLRWKEVATA